MKRREFITLVGGATAAWSLAARAQNATMSVVGLLSSTDLSDAQMNALRSGLGDIGYIEGRNTTILLRSAGGDFDQLPALAADLVNRQVAVIVALNSPVPARVAKAATGTIPIVFAYGGILSSTASSVISVVLSAARRIVLSAGFRRRYYRCETPSHGQSANGNAEADPKAAADGDYERNATPPDPQPPSVCVLQVQAPDACVLMPVRESAQVGAMPR